MKQPMKADFNNATYLYRKKELWQLINRHLIKISTGRQLKDDFH